MTSIDHVDLNLLRVFQAIVEERSLTKAGERLALSQPAVSYSLGRLRTMFDDPLFIRTRAGMQPTPVALELAEIVGHALDTVRQALRYAERFDPATSTRTFRLSLSDAGEMAYLPALCAALAEVRAAREAASSSHCRWRRSRRRCARAGWTSRSAICRRCCRARGIACCSRNRMCA